jgi:hypothetical protein
MLRNVRQLLIWACRDCEGQDVAPESIPEMAVQVRPPARIEHDH